MSSMEVTGTGELWWLTTDEVRLIEEHRSHVAAVARRRDLVAPYVCECGCETFTYWETGYSRSESCESDGETFAIYSDGWDSMSEGGDDAWIACDGCDATFHVPDDADWQ